MNQVDEKPKRPSANPGETPLLCSCSPEPFAELPPELRPPSKSSLSGLRQVTCPGCGLVYRTNRATDLCADCERRGNKPSSRQAFTPETAQQLLSGPRVRFAKSGS
jgi:hypothetical protein